MSSLQQRNLKQPPQSQSNFLEFTTNKDVELVKQHLKMAILAANYNKSMPPVYYLLKSKCSEPECAFAETHELPNKLQQDDPRLLPVMLLTSKRLLLHQYPLKMFLSDSSHYVIKGARRAISLMRKYIRQSLI